MCIYVHMHVCVMSVDLPHGLKCCFKKSPAAHSLLLGANIGKLCPYFGTYFSLPMKFRQFSCGSHVGRGSHFRYVKTSLPSWVLPARADVRQVVTHSGSRPKEITLVWHLEMGIAT